VSEYRIFTRTPPPKDIELVVVPSEGHPGELSLRAYCKERRRLSGNRLKEALREAGFQDGDVVTLSIKRAT
jgi:hypothetical protein